MKLDSRSPDGPLAEGDDTPSGSWHDEDEKPVDFDRSDVLPDASEYLDLSDEQDG